MSDDGIFDDDDEEVSMTEVDPALIKTESAKYIMDNILPVVVEHFLKKNADYGDQHREGLGPRGEFVGIHRKVGKLKRALWDGQEMNFEGTEEMLYELIGACLITLDLIDYEHHSDG